MILPRDALSRRTIRVFEKVGWRVDRVKGSHHIMVKPGVEAILSIPCHKGKPLKPGLLSKLIKAAGLTMGEFVRLYK